MKKKDLLSLPKLTVTEKMCQMVAEDHMERKRALHGTVEKYKTYQYYRAVITDGILKLAIFERKHIAAGVNIPEFELYVAKDEKKYLTYEPATGKWYTAKIDNLAYDYDKGNIYGNKPWVSDETKKKINAYLGTGKREPKEAVLYFQNDILKGKLEKRHRSEIEAIDEVMNAVPDLPKDFDQWVKTSAFIRERYIMYHAGTRKGYCTHCGKEVELKKVARHNTEGTCPNCKSKVYYKAWRKQKYLFDTKNVGILQRLTNGTGYILRKFHCRIERTLEKDWRVSFAGCWETQRRRLTEVFVPVELFEFGEYKHTGIDRWCHELNHGMGDYWQETGGSEECVLYHRNIKKLRKETDIQYIPLERLLSEKQGCYCIPSRLFRGSICHPQMEYLIKAGLYNIAWEAGKGYEELRWEEKKPWGVLGVEKEQMQQLIRINATVREMRVLKNANTCGMKLTDEQLLYFSEMLGEQRMLGIAKFGHMEKFYRYFCENFASVHEIGDYFDYLEDLKALNIPITKNELFPKNFQTIHENISMQRQERDEKIKGMKVEEKDRLLQEMLPELEEIYHGENEQFCIVLPTCKEDFRKEGRENHNCVGGIYFDKMIRGETVVFFLRKKEMPEKAFCTVEMEGSRIKQCRAIYNGTPPKEATEFMERFAKQVQKRIVEKDCMTKGGKSWNTYK